MAVTSLPHLPTWVLSGLQTVSSSVTVSFHQGLSCLSFSLPEISLQHLGACQPAQPKSARKVTLLQLLLRQQEKQEGREMPSLPILLEGHLKNCSPKSLVITCTLLSLFSLPVWLFILPCAFWVREPNPVPGKSLSHGLLFQEPKPSKQISKWIAEEELKRLYSN